MLWWLSPTFFNKIKNSKSRKIKLTFTRLTSRPARCNKGAAFFSKSLDAFLKYSLYKINNGNFKKATLKKCSGQANTNTSCNVTEWSINFSSIDHWHIQNWISRDKIICNSLFFNVKQTQMMQQGSRKQLFSLVSLQCLS